MPTGTLEQLAECKHLREQHGSKAIYRADAAEGTYRAAIFRLWTYACSLKVCNPDRARRALENAQTAVTDAQAAHSELLAVLKWCRAVGLGGDQLQHIEEVAARCGVYLGSKQK